MGFLISDADDYNRERFDDSMYDLQAREDYKREAYGAPCRVHGTLTWGGDCPDCELAHERNVMTIDFEFEKQECGTWVCRAHSDEAGRVLRTLHAFVPQNGLRYDDGLWSMTVLDTPQAETLSAALEFGGYRTRM
jgi:hypothetical protein